MKDRKAKYEEVPQNKEQRYGKYKKERKKERIRTLIQNSPHLYI